MFGVQRPDKRLVCHPPRAGRGSRVRHIWGNGRRGGAGQPAGEILVTGRCPGGRGGGGGPRRAEKPLGAGPRAGGGGGPEGSEVRAGSCSLSRPHLTSERVGSDTVGRYPPSVPQYTLNAHPLRLSHLTPRRTGVAPR